MTYFQERLRRLNSKGLLQAGLLLPALLLLLLIWVPASWLPAGAAVFLVFALLLVYPGYLLLVLLRGEWGLGRADLPIAFSASLGLLFVPATFLQVVGGSLDAFLFLCAVGVILLAGAALWQNRPRNVEHTAPLPVRPALLHRLHHRPLSLWAQDLFFWGAVILAVTLFVHYASIWRPTDRWTYQGIVLAALDGNAVAPANLLSGQLIPDRLELSPWLAIMAAMQRLSGAPLTDLYNYYLPLPLLLLTLCSTFLLGRQVLNGRWAAALAVLLLVLYWLVDISLPIMTPFAWQERMLLRLEGGQSTLGQWALLGRVVEDKFLLIFVLLPTFQALLLRYLGQGRRTLLLLLSLVLIAVTLAHPLGIVFGGFSFAALLPFQLLKLRTASTRRRRLLRLGLLSLLFALTVLIPWSQRQQLAAGNSEIVFTLRGQALIDYLVSLGLWTSTTSDSFYALHPYLIGRRALLVLALVLLPVVLLLRRLRKPGLQWLTGMVALSALIIFNPWIAPMLGRLITPNMLFRTWWLVVLPAVLILALAVQTGVALLRRNLARRRTDARTSRRVQTATAFSPLLLIVALAIPLWPQINAGLQLLDEIQANSLHADDLALLAYLREQAPPGSVVVAPEWVSNELPAFVGDVRPVAFRGNTIQPGGWSLAEFYAQDVIDVIRLQRMAEYRADFVVAPLPSALDQQLAHLGPQVTPVFTTARHRLYQLADGWQAAPAVAPLLEAADALSRGDTAAAASLAQGALAVEPANYTAAQVLSAALMRSGDFEGALAALDALPVADADTVWLSPLRAAVYRQQAAVAEQRGATALELAVLYRAALAADPGDLQAGRALAQLDAATGGKLLYSSEEQTILRPFREQTSLAAQPESFFPPSALQRRAIWNLAEIYELLGRAPDAEAAYRSALDLARPQWGEGEAVAELGRFLVRQDRVTEAAALYRSALMQNRGAKELYAALADLAALTGGHEAAAAVWQEAATANPLAPWPHIALAKLDLQAGSRPAPADTAANLPVNLAAQSALPLLDQAIAHLERAVALNPVDAEPYWLLTEAYMQLDNPPAVRAVWERAAAANPMSAWAWLALADVVRSQGDYTGLAAVLADALQALPAGEQTAPRLAAELAQVEKARAAQAHGRAYISGLNRYLPGVDLLVIDRPLASGWTLVALGVDQSAYWENRSAPVWLFWQAPNAQARAGATSDGWEQIAPDMWVQAVPTADNLVVDGSFERSAALGWVIGFTDDFYGSDPAARQVQTVGRSGEQTAAAVLVNRRAYLNSSFVTPPLLADAQKVYLHMGALRSEGGSGFLGLRWEDGDAYLGENHAVMGETRPAWRYAAQLVEPPPNATSVRAMLLNLQATGSVYFDNMLLLALDEPGD